MRSARRIGQKIGLLILLQLAGGLLVIFVLLRPLTTPPGFLEIAAASSLQLGVAVVLWFVAGALSIGIAIAAWPLFRRYSSAMALWLVILSAVAFPLLAVENATVMSMLSLSQDYAKAGAPDSEMYRTLAAAVSAARKWALLTSALVGECVIFVFYSILHRFRLVPRALSVLGLVTVMLKITALTMPFFGHRVPLPMVLPQPVIYLAVALWLMTKGFDERPHAPRPRAQAGAGLSSA